MQAQETLANRNALLEKFLAMQQQQQQVPLIAEQLLPSESVAQYVMLPAVLAACVFVACRPTRRESGRIRSCSGHQGGM